MPTHRFARVGNERKAKPVSALLGLNYDVLLGKGVLGRRGSKLVDLLSEEVLTPASCFPHIVGVSHELQRVWAVCLGKDQKPENQALPLSWYDMEGGSSALTEMIRFEDGDVTIEQGLLSLEGGRFLNLETGTVGTAACDPYAVAATHRDRVFCVEDDGAGFVYDLRSNERTAVSNPPLRFEHSVISQGAFFTDAAGSAGTIVVDMEQASVRGVVPGSPLGLSDKGKVLLANPPNGTSSLKPMGPLRWVDAADYCIPPGAREAQPCSRPSIAQR